jgi:hypothetical protein
MLLRFACPRSSSAAQSLQIGDVLKVVAELNDDGERGAEKVA